MVKERTDVTWASDLRPAPAAGVGVGIGPHNLPIRPPGRERCRIGKIIADSEGQTWIIGYLDYVIG